MDERMNDDSLTTMLDGLGRDVVGGARPEMGTRVVGALRSRRRARRAKGAAAVMLLVAGAVGIGAWMSGAFDRAPVITPRVAVLPEENGAATQAPREVLPAAMMRLTVGYLSSASHMNDGVLVLPDDAAEAARPAGPPRAAPLGPRSAAEMLRGL